MCHILSLMTKNIDLIHERVDDIPLLIGVAQRLNLPAVLDRHLGNHGHHQGLSNGWLTTVWLAYILSEADHRKSSVADWAQRHQHTLERLIQQPIRDAKEESNSTPFLTLFYSAKISDETVRWFDG